MHRSGSVTAPATLVIGMLRIDRAAAVTYADGSTLPIGAKVVATLVALHDRAGHVVPKAMLIESVWGGVAVDESSIWQNIHVLRGVLERHAPGNSIETVKGRGYRLVLEEARTAGVAASSNARTSDAASPAAALPAAALPVRKHVPGWAWSLGGAAAASLAFGVIHATLPPPREHRVLVLFQSSSKALPPLPALPGASDGTRIVLAPIRE